MYDNARVEEMVMSEAYDGKYRKLTEHLLGSPSDLVMTFEQIERLLGFSLPKSARSHQAWWANQPRGHSLAWLDAGYKAGAVTVEEERLTFRRMGEPEEASLDERRRSLDGAPLTIAEAKDRLAKTFGVDPSQIEIIVRA